MASWMICVYLCHEFIHYNGTLQVIQVHVRPLNKRRGLAPSGM